ncbi:MAG: sigma-70 family RNA polymerase sigma factor [Phycisphaeraceae bacterium]|nr:sigma-70 family RNA polymerase sigma factor [Phycisphaeraceae bacterium]
MTEPLPTVSQTPDPGPTDGDLAARVAEGDRDAAEALVRRHQTMVRRFLLSLCRRNALADDLAQETLVRMLEHAGSFDPTYSMKTWLLTIARRLWISHLRRADNKVGATDYRGLRTDDRGPDAGLDDQDRRQLLADAMETLSDPQRTTLLLFYQQELPIDEIATILEMPTNTVKSHLHRARAALRDQLDDRKDLMK